MSRPIKMRCVQGPQVVTEFMPNAKLPWGQSEIIFPVEGLEGVGLGDFEGLDRESAAARMNVSPQTFGKVLGSKVVILSFHPGIAGERAAVGVGALFERR